jgi:hypothetical protein
MPTDKNEYTRNEDPCLWELHEVRRAYAVSHKTVRKINEDARDFIKKSGANIIVVQPEHIKSARHVSHKIPDRRK